MKSFRVVNVVCSGQAPSKLMPLQLNKILLASGLDLQLVNENFNPILCFKFKKAGITANHKQKSVSVSVWNSGLIVVTGVLSLKEGQYYYSKVIKEIKRIQEVKP